MTPGTEIGMHIEVALAIAGEPLCIRMPEIWGVRLAEQLPRGRAPRTSDTVRSFVARG